MLNRFTDVNSFINFVESQKRFSPKVSLDKMRFYLSLFDNPHLKFKSIHITGTNGKGSVVAYLKSILRSAGYNIATFTSPYITYFNERIGFNESYISDDDLLNIGNSILGKYDDIISSGYDLPTFFEFITLLAFIYYSKIDNLDIVLVEVGMGGRLDATNVITPLLSIITNVTLEHTKILGDTLEKIAIEKLGIVKNDSYLISGNIDESLIKLFDKNCENKNTKHIRSALREVEIKKMDIDSSYILLDGHEFNLSLSGTHQIENALCAFEALETLKKIDKKWNDALSYEIYKRGFQNVSWQGRLEKISVDPLIIIDGCHNIDGVKKVTEFIKSLDYSYKRAVISISSDKDLYEMINLIKETFDEIIITKYSYMRSSEVSVLNELLIHPNKLIIENVNDALKYCENNKVDFTIFLGSLYLVSEVRNIKKPLVK